MGKTRNSSPKSNNMASPVLEQPFSAAERASLANHDTIITQLSSLAGQTDVRLKAQEDELRSQSATVSEHSDILEKVQRDMAELRKILATKELEISELRQTMDTKNKTMSEANKAINAYMQQNRAATNRSERNRLEEEVFKENCSFRVTRKEAITWCNKNGLVDNNKRPSRAALNNLVRSRLANYPQEKKEHLPLNILQAIEQGEVITDAFFDSAPKNESSKFTPGLNIRTTDPRTKGVVKAVVKDIIQETAGSLQVGVANAFTRDAKQKTTLNNIHSFTNIMAEKWGPDKSNLAPLDFCAPSSTVKNVYQTPRIVPKLMMKTTASRAGKSRIIYLELQTDANRMPTRTGTRGQSDIFQANIIPPTSTSALSKEGFRFRASEILRQFRAAAEWSNPEYAKFFEPRFAELEKIAKKIDFDADASSNSADRLNIPFLHPVRPVNRAGTPTAPPTPEATRTIAIPPPTAAKANQKAAVQAEGVSQQAALTEQPELADEFTDMALSPEKQKGGSQLENKGREISSPLQSANTADRAQSGSYSEALRQ